MSPPYWSHLKVNNIIKRPIKDKPSVNRGVNHQQSSSGNLSTTWSRPCLLIRCHSHHWTVDHRRLKNRELTVEMWTHWCVLLYCSGDFKRRLPRTPSTGTMSSADDLDEREPPSPSDNGESNSLHNFFPHVLRIFVCLFLRYSFIYFHLH